MAKGDRVLAERIEEALQRGLPLDALSANKQVLPPHMRCVGRSGTHFLIYSPGPSLMGAASPPGVGRAQRAPHKRPFVRGARQPEGGRGRGLARQGCAAVSQGAGRRPQRCPRMQLELQRNCAGGA